MSSGTGILNCSSIPSSIRACAFTSTSSCSLTTATTCLTHSPLNNLSFRLRQPRVQPGLSYRASSFRKLSITCGAVTEISESQFSDVVLKSDRPVLVEFVATWCGPCRLMASAIESVAEEYKDKLLVVKIDHDANPRLIEEYKVYGLPALIFFKNGQQIPESRKEGAIAKPKLKEYVDTMLGSASVS